MNPLQISLNEVKDLIRETMKRDMDNDGSVEKKLDVYERYVKCMKEIFIILDDNLNTYSAESKLEDLMNIRMNHFSILTTVQNCVSRLIIQISEDNSSKTISQSQSIFTEKQSQERPMKLRSLPARSSIDLLLAEKPATPITSAKCDIQKLVNATNSLLKSDKLSVSERASIQLRISRKIEENLSIARRHEDRLCRENTDSLEQLYIKVDKDIRTHKFLKDNDEFQTLYRSSQLFYHHILKDSRTYSLVQSHHSPESSCLSFILKMSNVHPVVSFIDKSVEKLLNFRVNKTNQNSFFDEIKTFKDNIEILSKLCCMIINTPLSDHIWNISPKLLTILFDFIFRHPRLSSFIYGILFVVYDEDLKQYNNNVKFIEDEYDYQILLPEKFKVQTDIIEILDKQVKEFTKLRQKFNPLDKIDMLAKVVTDLMSKIQNQNSELEIGADELVPILVYMIIKFNSAELFLHGKYLEHLLPDSYLIGIEGYMLVSIICAITFCVSDKFSQHVSKS